jgi:VWFA-related protein
MDRAGSRFSPRAAACCPTLRTNREKLRKAVNSVQPWTSGIDRNDCPPLTYSIADLLANKYSYTMFSPAQLVALMSRNEADPALYATYSATAGCTKLDQPPEIIAWMKAAIVRVLAYGDRETSYSLGAVKDVIRRLSTMPGERNLILISQGFLVTLDHRLAENDIFESAARANTAVNTIDMRGLYTLMPDASQEGFPIDDRAAADVLAELADGTGGTFFHDDNGFKEGLNQLAARPEYLYVLGFSPQDLKFDGSYHKLKVTVKDVANVSLQSRRGYWAPNHAVDASEAAKEELEEAVFSRDEIQDIPVTLDTEFFKSTEDRAELTVTARIKPGGLRFRRAEERSSDTVTVVTGLFDANGSYISGIERVITLRLRGETLASLERPGIVVKENFNVAPGRYVVRLVVRDSEGHTMSARNGGIEVP